ncbi:MAG: T9SS type A sorting domain-containing protein [Chlorobi bacterium]|nr:T9SS type A sorting domain-containing protein [Chlorobiota bacterium]
MKIKILILFFIAVLTNGIIGQTIQPVKILAVMVEFAEDKDSETFGNGKFGTMYSKDYGDDILDPLPHNKDYFSDHLLFVKNYFQKVSNGIVDVSYDILPDIYTVSQTMRNYSPTGETENFDELGYFSEEVWKLVAEANPDLNFDEYNMFLIFHAGVSKGLTLPGSIGNERDLPSVYFNLRTLKKIFGEDFRGFTSPNGSKITNTAIMPETDSRELQGFGQTSLIQLTINGYLCAMVGSYLGAPDLFNTATGKSSIGRFGLMDPQGFYAFNGTFPPEPSPWTKVFLGWIEPKVVNLENKSINLVAQRAAAEGDTTLLKIPITSTEYYLIENRSRDAHQDGVTVTYKVGGNVYTKNFTADSDSFVYYNVSAISGVVIDVDEPDWAIPAVDTNDEEGVFSDAGIVIWHIDESVVLSSVADNSVNADKDRRGVFIEEADGIFDIGEDFQNIFTGQTETREATKEDTWYSSNPAELYKNVFDKDSRPATVTNSGANSYISFTNFSDIGLTMSFDVSFGGEYIKPISTGHIGDNLVGWLTNVNTDDGELFFTRGSNVVSEIDSLGNVTYLYGYDSFEKPAAVKINGGYALIGSALDSIAIFVKTKNWTQIIKRSVNPIISMAPVVVNSKGDEIEFLTGNSEGAIQRYKLDLSVFPARVSLVDEYQTGLNFMIKALAVDGNYFAAIADNKYEDSDGVKLEFGDMTAAQISVAKDDKGNRYSIVTLFEDLSENKSYSVAVVKGESLFSEFKLTDNSPLLQTAVCDLKMEGKNYILVEVNGELYAYNLNGSLADNFPVKLTDDAKLSFNILAADLDLDDREDVIAVADDGTVYAVSGESGEMIDGFPISVGGRNKNISILYTQNDVTSLAVVTQEGYFSNWNISRYDGRAQWRGVYGNNLNTSFTTSLPSDDDQGDYFREDKAYNWPNPVYGGETYFRYYVGEDSKINIKIFDLGGELVDELIDTAPGGIESETVWNVSSIQSGVYMARLKATSNSDGKSDAKLIKVVVIK